MSCQGVLTSASIYCYKDQNQTYCSSCHHIRFPQDQTNINNNAQWHIVPQARPILKQLTFDIRMTSASTFGTVKVCPGCQHRIVSVHDEYKGPQAVSWHRQCLVCCTCRKSLDSSAKVHVTHGKRLVPSCTTCLVSHFLLPINSITNDPMNDYSYNKTKLKEKSRKKSERIKQQNHWFPKITAV